MIFDLDNLNPATKFHFDDTDESKGFVELRICTGDDLNDIYKRTETKKRDFKKGQRYEHTEVNEKKRNHEMWDFMIVNWGGIQGPDGKDIKCIRENKIKLMGQSIEFMSFVTERVSQLTDMKYDFDNELEKN